MMYLTRRLLSFLLISVPRCIALTVSPEAASASRARLQEALRSLSGKMTLCPEIIIPEPTDPTALLLQTTAITKLSTAIRTKAKANAACVTGTLNSLRTFCSEQDTVRGNFPGPIPVIYSHAISICGESLPAMEDIAEAGVTGVIVAVCGGKEITSIEQVKTDASIAASSVSASKHGMHIIPEVVLSHTFGDGKGIHIWSEENISALVDSIVNHCGAEPAAILLTIQDVSESSDANYEEHQEAALPKIPKALAKRMPIIGSIRALAGQNRMSSAVANLKAAGFTGAFLRSECVPGFRMNPDLDFVSGFWVAAISDIKSTKSKTFNFRSKVALDRDIPLEWYNYQKSVMESGALGPSGGGGDPVDTANGDFLGF